MTKLPITTSNVRISLFTFLPQNSSFSFNDIRSFFANHNTGCVGVSGHNFRHYRSVRYSQSVNTFHSEKQSLECKTLDLRSESISKFL